MDESVNRSGTEYKGSKVVKIFLVCQISFPGIDPWRKLRKQNKKPQNNLLKNNKKKIKKTWSYWKQNKKEEMQEKTGIQWS